MQSDTVYAKTAKGIEELEHRTVGLGAITRRLLIQIDGQRSVAQLVHDNARWMDVSAALEELRSQGLISEPGQAGDSVGPAPVDQVGGSLRDALIAMATSILGDAHTDRIKAKLGSIPANDADSLGEVVDSCVRLIRLTIDEDKAEDFRRQAQVILAPKD